MEKKSSAARVATCGDCACWNHDAANAVRDNRLIGDKRGVCMAVPPTPTPVYEGSQIVGQRNFRPITVEKEPACSLFCDKETMKLSGVN